ncbi:n-alpha-acetyltransferase 50 [Anaeramoeba flamelloides]|uniref:N-terminal methionine N(alpha)-acetyltransferase NatE n=1 Tax=Anaeramoeba flamelloides TaxID=1746091 RepID=A0AAV8A097_9EUKA|nr:n-alpha-acetyltransferase [Anaeramoeba flamelloides]KAJ6239860.1 n-alpha-acetyltransferase 50 [Anaeramoeba flamelloides]
MSNFVTYGELNEKNIKQLKLLNSAVLPARYSNQFYMNLLLDYDYHMNVAFYCKDVVVGAISYRKERPNNRSDQGNYRCYILTFSVLETYRREGIGSELLRKVLNFCREDEEIKEVYLHVQVSNDLAIEFYKKFGFQITETVKGYYKKIDVKDAYKLTRTLK